MKHNLRITLVLIAIFIFTQIFGLFVASNYIIADNISTDGIIDINQDLKPLPLGMQRPEINQNFSFLYIVFGIVFGTVILLILAKYKRKNTWKLWYLFAVIMSITVTLGAFIKEYIALSIAVILGLIKIYKSNPIIHNVSEVLIYAGIATIFIPILNVLSAIILLILISIYDAYAVWKSKHMIKLAKFQTGTGVFAGLNIPYNTSLLTKFQSIKNEEHKKPSKKTELKNKTLSTNKTYNVKESKNTHTKKTAILGGGDIAFPLLFSGAIMQQMIASKVPIMTALLKIQIITLFATVAIAYLFFYGKKDKFYPAMPFISAGCFIGYAVMLLV